MTHVLETPTVSSETFVERNRESLVVFPVRYARRDHPLLLLCCCCFSRWTSQYRRRRTWWTTRNFLVLEPRRLQWIFRDFSHFDKRCLRAPSFPCCPGVYRTKLVLPWPSGTFLGCAALIFPFTNFSNAAFVRSAVS